MSPRVELDERQVQRYDVGALEQLVQGAPLDAEFLPGSAVRRDLGVEPDHPHSHCDRLAGGHATDAAETHEAHRLSRDLAALREHLARPTSGGDCRARQVGGAAKQDHRHRQDVFRHGLRVRPRGREDRDATRCARLEIDVVQADAEPPHDAQAGGGCERVSAHLSAVAHDPGIRTGKRVQEAGRVVHERRPVVDVEVAREHRHGGGVHVF